MHTILNKQPKYNENIWRHLVRIPVCKNTIFQQEIWEGLRPMTLLYAMTDYVKWNACLWRKKMEKYQNNKWALGKRGRGVVQEKAFCELLAEVIFCAQRCREIERNRGSASVSQLVIALSQSMEPWKPSQRWAGLLCSSWRACFISPCSSSTLTSKLINSRLLFLPLGYEGVSMKISTLLCTGRVNW